MLDPYRAHLTRLPFALTITASAVILFTPASGVPTAPPGTDKIVHLVLFATLAITGHLARVRCTALLIGLSCYAAASELLQAVLPLGRTGDLADAAVDLVGIGVGVLITAGLRRYRR
ncbi:VanZ family protein [Haloactinomyces albus]|uniref:VanZ family protein n=1 Tax=Haloactinomyces albus TaxID=1352928 RepID=A0AAE4CM06_9ACTN|nr:VanZ family protein [Haloactinomyces albus]MDR7300492.1 VanZ family protein [Haloactinomyces albus]